ncbi:MAG: choice-of-anchor tandem repeat GloVer-containing protein, partial [Mycobacterium sp.]
MLQILRTLWIGMRPLTSLVMLSAVSLTTMPSECQTYKFALLHSFAGTPDGAMPSAGMVFDTEGNLYGTTPYGGKDTNEGTVFRYSSSGVESVLFAFHCATSGAYPSGPLTIDGSGNLYGVTFNPELGCDCKALGSICPTASGGSNGGRNSFGTLFEISAGGERNLAMFDQLDRGPSGALALDPAGNLYGVSEDAQVGPISGGGLFIFNTPSGEFNFLYYFDPPGDENPYSGPLLDSDGNLIGTTAFGGLGSGDVYAQTASGNYCWSYTFIPQNDDGMFPLGTPVMD